MSFDMRLWRVDGSRLIEISSSALDQERRLEDWIATDSSILGMELTVIGRQIQTPFRGQLDLLAIDPEGNTVVLELKRGRTPRDVVAQLLDYGSWVKDLGYSELDDITRHYRGSDLATVFSEAFDLTIPETVNAGHNLVVVASELDDSSERIINYLSEECGLSINAVFFKFFQDGPIESLGRAWLRDPVETLQRSEARKRSPWTGYWFVNVGEGPHRNWDDNVEYGYIGAGQGERYSRPLQHLKIGNKVFAYMRGLGYVGFGEVVKEALPIDEYVVDDLGKNLLDLPLRAPQASENRENPELSEWAVGIRWTKTFPRSDAKTFRGAFANQNIVCKLRDSTTLDFLQSEFELQ